MPNVAAAPCYCELPVGRSALTINNSTFSSNTTRYEVGSDITLYGGTTLKLTNSTFNGPASPLGRIGNIGGMVTVGNTILQTGPGGVTFAGWNGSVISLGYNLASDNAGGSFAAIGDQVNTDALLGPLKDNGGPTLTHAPLINSPVVDKGKRDTIAALATDIDQRGSVRPVDDPVVANAAGGDASDIGAVEIGVGVHPISAASWKLHGDAGSFPIDLPLTGTPGTECRSGGPNGDYQVIVTFSQAITFSSAAVTSGIGHVTGATLISDSYSKHPNRADGAGGTQVAINLTGVTNMQVVTVALFDVADGTHSGDVGIRMAVLVGDTTNNRKVTVSDVSQTKFQSGHVVTADNFRTDVIADGSINTSDISLVKSKSGTWLLP